MPPATTPPTATIATADPAGAGRRHLVAAAVLLLLAVLLARAPVEAARDSAALSGRGVLTRATVLGTVPGGQSLEVRFLTGGTAVIALTPAPDPVPARGTRTTVRFDPAEPAARVRLVRPGESGAEQTRRALGATAGQGVLAAAALVGAVGAVGAFFAARRARTAPPGPSGPDGPPPGRLPP